MFQESRREVEDLPALKTALTSIQQLEYNIKNHERGRITVIRNDTGDTMGQQNEDD